MADDETTKTDVTSHESGADAGGRAHTRLDEGHPAGDGPRTDREVGGPTPEEGAETSGGTGPGGHGDRPTEGHEPHE